LSFEYGTFLSTSVETNGALPPSLNNSACEAVSMPAATIPGR